MVSVYTCLALVRRECKSFDRQSVPREKLLLLGEDESEVSIFVCKNVLLICFRICRTGSRDAWYRSQAEMEIIRSKEGL